jgi:hypothetical protein
MISFDQYFFKESSTRKWLELLRGNQNMKDFAYSGTAAFILEHGYEYKSQEWTKEDDNLLNRVLSTLKADTCIDQSKRCYLNAQIIAVKAAELGIPIRYCEGFADSLNGLPLEHAWIVIGDPANPEESKVIDFTWQMNNEGGAVKGVIPDGWSYIGVPLPASEITKRGYGTEDSIESSPLIDDWSARWPLLKKRFKGDIVNEINIQDEEDDEAEFISLYPDNWDKVYPIMRKAVTSKAWASSWANSFLNAADPKIGGPDEAIKANPNFKNWTTIHFQSLWDDVWHIYTDQGSLEDNGIRRL